MHLFGILGLFLALTLGLRAEDFRVWQTVGGGHFDARLVAVGEYSVKLANYEGQVITFPMAELSSVDHQYIDRVLWELQNPDFAEVESDRSIRPQPVRASERSLGPVAKRSPFATLVYRQLLSLDGDQLSTYEAPASENPKYFAFYRSALWCAPCQKFTPILVHFYNEQKSMGADFELVFMSSDKDEASMEEYMLKAGMAWPAFPLGKNRGLVSANGLGIPNLIITDSEGKKLLDSYDESGEYIGPGEILKQFEKLLAEN